MSIFTPSNTLFSRFSAMVCWIKIQRYKMVRADGSGFFKYFKCDAVKNTWDGQTHCYPRFRGSASIYLVATDFNPLNETSAHSRICTSIH
jgi:hypothetical protein